VGPAALYGYNRAAAQLGDGMSEILAELMEQAWSSMEEVASQLTPGEWDLPTDCPGWLVRDQVAHTNAIEGNRLGRPWAPGEPVQAAHVRNELGAVNEREILHRRDQTPGQLLDDLRDVTSQRAKFFAALSEEEWRQDAAGLIGTAPMSEVVKIRILDVFYHDQDIRVATGRPGAMHGDVARFVFERMASSMPFVVGKRAAPADGESVVFEVGSPGETFTIGMSGSRAGPLEQLPESPTVRLQMDCESFLRLCGGRWSPKRVEEEGRLHVTGDRDLADRVLSNMAVTP
jgi:uncharacterized protein (TIGR03083 family)